MSAGSWERTEGFQNHFRSSKLAQWLKTQLRALVQHWERKPKSPSPLSIQLGGNVGVLCDETHHGRVKAGRRGAVTAGLTHFGLSLVETIQLVPKGRSPILAHMKGDECNK